MDSLVLTPSDFVALLNQTLETAYPQVIIEGELSNLRVSKNRWVYFDLRDEESSVKFFGTVYMLPGPLQDGMMLNVIGSPRLHPKFGFSINIQSIAPVGDGSIKKAADLLQAKLAAEGLFEVGRKRPLPQIPKTIGLVTAANSAAYTDFLKILNERWGGVEIQLADVYVQGRQAPLQIVKAIEYFNELSQLPDILVVTRGGGSLEDLASFNDERVVRAVAASRIPTLVAVGHEVDVSLAELAADQRASTPSNAAQLAVPSRSEVLKGLHNWRQMLSTAIKQSMEGQRRDLSRSQQYLTGQTALLVKTLQTDLVSARKLVRVFDPRAALARGYAIISKNGRHISSLSKLKLSDRLNIQLADGTVGARVEELNNG